MQHMRIVDFAVASSVSQDVKSNAAADGNIEVVGSDHYVDVDESSD